MVFFVSVWYGFWASIMVFFASEIGDRISNAYEEIDDEMGQLDWYSLPPKIQIFLPTIIINTQQPMFIKCFGSATCSRETFKKVSPNYS